MRRADPCCSAYDPCPMAESAPRSDMTRSSRDPETLRTQLETWLRARGGASTRATMSRATSANGMSSETILFDATWRDDERERSERLVARLAPAQDDVPVFPTYDLRKQYDTIRLVGELSGVPVPQVWWYEADPSVAGAPFFVMSRVDGDVPPDVMPYAFGDNWLFDASPEDQRRLQDASVDVLADLHAIDGATEVFAFLDDGASGETPLARKIGRTRDWYEWVVADASRSKTIDAALDWLEVSAPSDAGPTVLSWGDSRIGNVMYRDFVPVAVLDWEMACLGPRELDLAWLIYSHQIFQELAEGYEPWRHARLHARRRCRVTVRVARRDMRRNTSSSTSCSRRCSGRSCSCAPGSDRSTSASARHPPTSMTW